MHHPDLRHHARDRIVAAEVMKLDLHEAEPHATRGEPGVIETRKPRRAAPCPTKCALAGASRRSPLTFARSLRLTRSRRVLLQPRKHTSISETARACGFTHMGQFAHAYRGLFGESPSATLQRAQGSG